MRSIFNRIHRSARAFSRRFFTALVALCATPIVGAFAQDDFYWTQNDLEQEVVDDEENAPVAYALVEDDEEDVGSIESIFPGRRQGWLTDCFDDVVYRGQNSIVPPVESSSNATIGSSVVSNSTANFALPPVVGSDKPFEPVPIETTEDSTTLQKMFKYRQNISGSYLFIPRAKNRGLGVHELEARLLFAFPCKLMQNAPQVNNGYFLLTPSFVYDNISLSKHNDSRVKMPTNFFDAGLTTSFLGQFQDLEAKVEVSVGIAASFKKIKCKAIYVRGRAELALPVDNEKQFKVLGGVAYLDRIKYKLVPIFGFTWDPNPQNQFRIVFPNPRWSHYLAKVNETDWWFYLNGDIGGDRWYMSDPHAPVRGKTSYNIDYNDYKFGAGIAFDCSTRLKGSFEVGGAFKRELRTKHGVEYRPHNAVYLKVGLFY